MSLVRMLLFLAIGFIVWRMIRVFMRMSGGSRKDEVDPFAAPRQTRGMPGQGRIIKDAEFEDLTPPRNAANNADKKRV